MSGSDEELMTHIRAAGLRRTRGRLLVLRHVVEAAAPVSHGEVCDGLSALGLDRASVYRNLMDLTRVGLLRRFDVGDHTWRFEHATDRSPDPELTQPDPGPREGAEAAAHPSHPHFVCEDCGTVQCLPAVNIEVDSHGHLPMAVSEQRVTIQLRGVCDDCQ